MERDTLKYTTENFPFLKGRKLIVQDRQQAIEATWEYFENKKRLFVFW